MTPRPYRQAERHETTAYAVMSAKGTPIFSFESLEKAQAFMADRERKNVRAFIVRETIVREAVCAYLKLVVPSEVIWFAASNGAVIGGTGKVRAMRVARLKRMGMKVGIPDLIFMRRHHPFGIELKAPGKEKNLSPNQRDVRKDFASAGLLYYVATSIDEVTEILRLERIIN